MVMDFFGQRRWISQSDKEFKRGGNSQVFLVGEAGTHPDEHEHALKLYSSPRASEERYARFLAEIEIVKSLSTIDGCVSYVDHGLYEDRPFYVMPYYRKGTFRDRYLINSSSSMGVVKKLEDYQSVLQIVRRLHDIGLAIRDIKPQNILVDNEDYPAIADFGLSLWCTTPDEERLTPIDGMVGSQGYRAPEWLNAYPELNHRPGDIWSLGRTLWALFAAKNPPDNSETMGGAGTHLKSYVPKEYANIVQSIVTACTAQTPGDRPTISELIDQVEVVKQHVLDIERGDVGTRRGVEMAMKTFSMQVTNSDVFIDSKRLESETNIKLSEIKSCVEQVFSSLSNILSTSSHGLGEDFGVFRVNKADHSMMFRLKGYGLTLNLSDNHVWNKCVSLRFDPADSLQEHKEMSYVLMNCYMGLTEEKRFYWLVSSRDQTTREEYIVEQLETKSLESLISNKVSQLGSFAVEHFFDRIEMHFRS